MVSIKGKIKRAANLLPKVSIERWKYNKQYDIYVSSFGNLMDKKYKLINPQIGCGYLYYQGRSIHRIVMETFKPVNGYSLLTVDHLNHNTRDNRLSNLEWVTREENETRAMRDEISSIHVSNNTNPVIKSQEEPQEERYYVNGEINTKAEVVAKLKAKSCADKTIENLFKSCNAPPVNFPRRCGGYLIYKVEKNE